MKRTLYKVQGRKFIGRTEKHGMIPATDRYEIELSCGHTITRPNSRAHYKFMACATCELKKLNASVWH